MTTTRRNVFISHYKGDRTVVDEFIRNFSSVLIAKSIGTSDNDDFINSSDTDYVMACIRKKYIGISSVTIVLIGKCTHSRRYVDWEIKATLQKGDSKPTGLIGILLPGLDRAHLPPRFGLNWNKNNNCYARFYKYPTSVQQLSQWIEDAHQARDTRSNLINNPQDRMKNNAKCNICGVTH